MEAKNLKNGDNIYLFDRGEATISEGKVVSISLPHYDTNIQNPTLLVIDVTVEVGGEQRTYIMRDSAEISYNGNLSVCAGREVAIREVEGVKTKAEQTIKSIDHIRMIADKCGRILADLNPAEKEKKEMEKWKRGMESDVKDLKGMMKTLLNELKSKE